MLILPNKVAVIDGDTHHAVWCRDEGLVHDKFTAKIIAEVLAALDNKVCIDVGANIGTLTRAMLDAGGKVHCFEANPKAVECLRHNCPEATIYPCGLGSETGRLFLYESPNAGASHVGPITPAALGVAPSVPIEPLDRYGLTPGFIKLDIEGFEVHALEGAFHTITRAKPVILTEVNAEALKRAGTSADRLYSVLAGHRYNMRIIQPDCSRESPQYDLLCIP